MGKRWIIGKEHRPKCFCYLRVSTGLQDNEKNKAEVLKFCNERDFGKVEFIEEVISGRHPWRKRKIGEMIEGMQSSDILVVPEISRIGRSMIEVLEVLSILKAKGCRVYSLKGNWSLDDSIQSKVMATVLAMCSEIERDLIRLRTIEGLNARRAKGLPLGRPRGLGRSRLDPHKDEVIALLRNGSPKTYVARKYKVSVATLFHYIRRHELDVSPRIEDNPPELRKRV